MGVHLWPQILLFCLFCIFWRSSAEDEYSSSSRRYDPKNCKFHPLPIDLDSIGYLGYNGETYVGDVFGIPDNSKSHSIIFTIHSKGVITLSAELHRDVLVDMSVEIFSLSSSSIDGSPLRVLKGSNTYGAGGERTKAFLTGEIGDRDHSNRYEIVFTVSSTDISREATGGEGATNSINKSSCFPVRLDIAIVPMSRILSHISDSCTSEVRLPPTYSDRIIVTGETPYSFSSEPNKPFSFPFVTNEPQWRPFEKVLWTEEIFVPAKMHRFVRFYSQASFRFVTGPIQLLIELLPDVDEDITSGPEESKHENTVPSLVESVLGLVRPHAKDNSDASSKDRKSHLSAGGAKKLPVPIAPACQMGCIAATPTFNGFVLNHAFPSGFTYRLWLLAGEPIYGDTKSSHCIEADFALSVELEERLTPFEVSAATWTCKAARLPHHAIVHDAAAAMISQPVFSPTGRLTPFRRGSAEGNLGPNDDALEGLVIELDDWYMIPPSSPDVLSHIIVLDVVQPALIRVTTHDSAAFDIHMILSLLSDPQRPICPSVPITSHSKTRRESIFCPLPVGVYALGFYADLPLGGIKPCSAFHLDLSLRAINSLPQDALCPINSKIPPPTIQLANFLPPIPLRFDEQTGIRRDSTQKFFIHLPPTPKPTKVLVTSKVITVLPNAGRINTKSKRPNSQVYFRGFLRSNPTSADLRFSLSTGNNQNGKAATLLTDPQALYEGAYTALIGPLDPGEYTLEIFYISRGSSDPYIGKDGHAKGKQSTLLSDKLNLCTEVELDAQLVERTSSDLKQVDWACKAALPKIPTLIDISQNEVVQMHSQYLLPRVIYHDISLKISDPSVLRLTAVSSKGHCTFDLINENNRLIKSSSEPGEFFSLINIPGTYTLRINMIERVNDGSNSCATITITFNSSPLNILPSCPAVMPNAAVPIVKANAWHRSTALNPFHLDLTPRSIKYIQERAQQLAEAEAEKIRNARLAAGSSTDPVDAVAVASFGHEDLSKSFTEEVVDAHDADHVWWAPDAGAIFPLSVDHASVTVRIEIESHPAWAPVVVEMRSVANSEVSRGSRLVKNQRDPLGGSDYSHQVRARGVVKGNRILLIDSDVPFGNYEVVLRPLMDPDVNATAIANKCSHIRIFVDIGVNDDSAGQSLRAEMLDVPSLAPSQSLPPTLNAVGLFSRNSVSVQGTFTFAIGKSSTDGIHRDAFDNDGNEGGRRDSYQQEESFNDPLRNEIDKLIANNKGSIAHAGALFGEDKMLRDIIIHKGKKLVEDRSHLHLLQPTLLRIVCEPIDLSLDDPLLTIYSIPVAKGSTPIKIAQSDKGILVIVLQPGNFLVGFGGSGFFLTTLGIASVDVIKMDARFQISLASIISNNMKKQMQLKNGKNNNNINHSKQSNPLGISPPPSSTSECSSSPPILLLPKVNPQDFNAEEVHSQMSPSTSTSLQKAQQSNPILTSKGYSLSKTFYLSPEWLKKTGDLLEVPIDVSSHSIIHLEAGSPSLVEFVRAGVLVPEGLWVGEQRSNMNVLRLELPPGRYIAKFSVPSSLTSSEFDLTSPYLFGGSSRVGDKGSSGGDLASSLLKVPPDLFVDRCFAFTINVRLTPISMPSLSQASIGYKHQRTRAIGEVRSSSTNDDNAAGEADNEESDESAMGAECMTYGAVPLPLDFTAAEGGSYSIGGPVSNDGRLLVRGRFFISDLKDGRKKIYLKAPKDSILKVSVRVPGSGGSSGSQGSATTMAFRVKTSGSGLELPVVDWQTSPGSWDRIYRLKAREPVWLELRRADHANGESSASGCVVFDMAVALEPTDLFHQMSQCPSQAPTNAFNLDKLYVVDTVAGTGVVRNSFNEVLPSNAIQLYTKSGSINSGQFFTLNSGLVILRESRSGFVHHIDLKIDEPSLITLSVEFNFILSHLEADIVPVGSDDQGQPLSADQTSNAKIAFFKLVSDLDFIGPSTSPLNARQYIETSLPAGQYKLRIADDHWPLQFQSMYDSRCFPLRVNITVAPQYLPPNSKPTSVINSQSAPLLVQYKSIDPAPRLLSIHPHPSMPIMHGQDLLVTLRFSSPPSISETEISEHIGLIPVEVPQVSMPGLSSMNMNVNNRNANALGRQLRPSAFVQSWGEGGLVWYFVWADEDIRRLRTAQVGLVWSPIFQSKLSKSKMPFGIPDNLLSIPLESSFSKGGAAVSQISGSGSFTNKNEPLIVFRIAPNPLSPGFVPQSPAWLPNYDRFGRVVSDANFQNFIQPPDSSVPVPSFETQTNPNPKQLPSSNENKPKNPTPLIPAKPSTKHVATESASPRAPVNEPPVTNAADVPPISNPGVLPKKDIYNMENNNNNNNMNDKSTSSHSYFGALLLAFGLLGIVFVLWSISQSNSDSPLREFEMDDIEVSRKISSPNRSSPGRGHRRTWLGRLWLRMKKSLGLKKEYSSIENNSGGWDDDNDYEHGRRSSRNGSAGRHSIDNDDDDEDDMFNGRTPPRGHIRGRLIGGGNGDGDISDNPFPVSPLRDMQTHAFSNSNGMILGRSRDSMHRISTEEENDEDRFSMDSHTGTASKSWFNQTDNHDSGLFIDEEAGEGSKLNSGW